jgi:hypothetical protein
VRCLTGSGTGLFAVFKFLSPQDLVAAAKASRCLARASNTPALWRHLFLLRWGQNAVETGSEMEAYVSWKKLYFERDSEEMDRLTRHGDAVLGDIYLKMHISQRSKVRRLPPPIQWAHQWLTSGSSQGPPFPRTCSTSPPLHRCAGTLSRGGVFVRRSDRAEGERRRLGVPLASAAFVG